MGTSGPPAIITLTTDFGTCDHYVAVMKGVIAGICPSSRVIDVSHDVAPYQIGQGAYLLSQAWPWFPKGTVHIAVVDPGVGSERRALAVEAGGCRFVLPDNGLVDLLGLKDPVVHAIRNERLFLQPISRTFHGRDIFAPVGAHLVCGLEISETGPRIEDWIRADIHAGPRILHIDRFGNLVTSLRSVDGGLHIGDREVRFLATHYAEAPAGEPFLIIGSGGYVEVSVREGSAKSALGAYVGQAIGMPAPDHD